MRARLVGITLATALVTFLAGDALGISRLGPGILPALEGAVVAAILAASAARVVKTSSMRAATFAFAVVVICVLASLPWVSLGPFGAGPLGEMAVLVIPLAVLIGARD